MLQSSPQGVAAFAIHSTGIQWYSSIISFVQNFFWVWVTHLRLLQHLFLFLCMEVHTYMQYYTGFQLGFWLCNNTQFWVWVVHGNSLLVLFWFDGVPVGKFGRYQVVLLPWSTCPEFMSTFAIAWPPASAWSFSSSSPVLFFSSFPPHSRSFLRRRPDWGSWTEGVLWGQRT